MRAIACRVNALPISVEYYRRAPMAFRRWLVAVHLPCWCGVLPIARPGAPASDARSSSTSSRPSILLVTLDTTRADAVGPEARGVETRGFNALAARGLRFRQAYATAPETLPSHSSMMTGLYPAGHGIHENARYLSDTHPVLAARLKDAGYRTAAFVSSFILSRRFGLARGFDVYDDSLPSGQVERTSRATTDAADRVPRADLRATRLRLGSLLRSAHSLRAGRRARRRRRARALSRRGGRHGW